MICSRRILFVGYAALLFLVLILQGCYARTNNNCTTSCGNIHNISYPFRLKTDPESCGHKEYELTCENNLPVAYLDSAKYYVESINYNNYTIRVVDAGFQKDNCSSIPGHSLNTFYNSYWEIPYYQRLIFVNCEDPVQSSPLYVDASSCINNSGHWYVMVGSTNLSDLADSCRIEQMALISIMPEEVENISYKDLHRIMSYGFELSWFHGCCDNYKENLCNLPDDLIDYCRRLGTIAEDIIYDAFDILYGLFYLRERDLFGDLQSLPSGSSRLDHARYYAIGSSRLDHARYYAIGLLPYLLTFLVLYRVTLCLCGTPCVISFLIYKWKRRHLSMYDNIEEFLQGHNNFLPIRYSYFDIKRITRGFKDKLGEGGYGLVYKGKLRSGQLVAIKILGKSKANGQEFINEVATIGRIYHVNVVRLIGFCVERSKRALVYEFMPNGSLDKHIFLRGGSSAISIEKMYEISLGVAQGIEYLHRGCNMQILHFDIKPHNILLNESFIPKISDFGLAKLYPPDNDVVSLTAARGTWGYMAPELINKNLGGASHKADVYSFGILLMEMVGRRKTLNASAEHLSQIYFPTWAYDKLSEGKDVELGDVSDEEKKIANKMVLIALWCTQLEPIHRPSMHAVIKMFEAEFETLEMPPKPLLSLQDKKKEDIEINVNPIGPTSTPTGDCMDSVSLVANAY
ncbi:hypothetical protein P3X46_000587 [Hevea brasiliensis]|uniref:Protein kinase domain-containing protein n=1 Tax=Hevea brasiliensis TaxID=3981 RepID=A0ABQ9NBT9_HEVBR|nr:hypothetical protein P3X46_000587 [Hevea brasiliensis]